MAGDSRRGPPQSTIPCQPIPSTQEATGTHQPCRLHRWSPCTRAARLSSKHNFPIDYTLRVQHEEVLRTANVTRLRDGKVSEASLRYLWFHACSQAVLHILEVLPEKHPSRGYTQELSQLLDALGVEYSGYRQSDVDAVVADLVKQLHSGDSRQKAVRPKALLDNCLKVLRMLFGAHCRWDSA
uniref:Interleukin 34 n=1 Tax=Gallus gallus TaxID=9031 RepID=A0A8V1A2J9_CHICK